MSDVSCKLQDAASRARQISFLGNTSHWSGFLLLDGIVLGEGNLRQEGQFGVVGTLFKSVTVSKRVEQSKSTMAPGAFYLTCLYWYSSGTMLDRRTPERASKETHV